MLSVTEIKWKNIKHNSVRQPVHFNDLPSAAKAMTEHKNVQKSDYICGNEQ